MVLELIKYLNTYSVYYIFHPDWDHIRAYLFRFADYLCCFALSYKSYFFNCFL